MEANVFITKLKADGAETDLTDLDEVFKEYGNILGKLAAKDRGPFSLNVLCILCRNLEKVPSWRAAIDNKSLVTLSVECTQETRTLDPPGQVKALACIYHIHKYVVRQNTTVPPDLILKLSYVPFETENLIAEYCKTYWNIMADRIIYIEKQKNKNMNVIKLLRKFTEDVLKVIKVYNTVQFTSTVLTFLVKKLHFLFSNLDAKELNKTFGEIFEELQSKADLRQFKKLQNREIFDIYMILNDCLYVIVENTVKSKFAGSVLNTVVQTCISIVGHQQDLLHCLQTVYLNGFCTILNENRNLAYVESVLSNFVTSCEAAEKIGYTKAINATYPYINQYLRLYIEHNITDNQKNWQKQFPEQIQMACLKLMEFLLEKAKNCDQILKCENCSVKSGLHDALKLSFVSKNLISIPLQENMSVTKALPVYFSITLRQYQILDDLCKKGCANYDKCYRKLQSDVHNTAITLNKSQNFEYSIKLFELYLKNEILHFKNEDELKNFSRALYNKSICELDCKQYEPALLDAYLSLTFAYPDGLKAPKHMSLVMDIKAKVLKSENDSQADTEVDDLQTLTVLDACAIAIEGKRYGNLKPFFCNLKFSALLKHEFEMYAKIWPSITPIAGVWKTLHDLTLHDVPWMNVTDEDIQRSLYDVIMETPTVVRNINNEQFTEVITDLLQSFEESPPKSVELNVLYVTVLFLKAEFDLVEAGVKFGWKTAELSVDPDQFEARRTLSQEHEATKRAIQAVDLWTDVVKHIHTVPITPRLHFALQTAQVFVPQLLHLFRTLPALRLAAACCRVAGYIHDKTSYILNASAILYYANTRTDEIAQIIATANKYCAELLKNKETVETALVFLGDCAIYYNKINSRATSAKITQAVQAKIIYLNNSTPDLNLDMAVGKLLEAQAAVCADRGPSGLSAVISAHRHYRALGNCETKWCYRRRRALNLKLHITCTGIACATYSRRLLAWRRARSCACATLSAACAVGHALLVQTVTDVAHTQHAAVQIDNRLKYILGMQSSSDQPIPPTFEAKTQQYFTPRQGLETMLENMTFKKNQVSPSLPIDSVPGFKYPEFLTHGPDCNCFACENPYSIIMTCRTTTLEASMYFRAKEFDIARNYFDGSRKCLKLSEEKLNILKNVSVDQFLIEIVQKIFRDEFSEVQIETLIESAFFELSQNNYKSADERIVTVHEILQDNENINPYLRNEILNLMTSSARIRQLANRQISNSNLETEFENLKLSPAKQMEAPKTPETKAEKPPQISKIKVAEEEVPNTKRRVIKLNLDENSPDEKETSTKKITSKRTEFKIPVPVTAKAVLESMTPTVSRRQIPDISVQPPNDECSSILEFATPKPKNVNNSELFTPIDTPGDQFFTPMSTLKTYSKKTLRHGIVKNLESEFATPKAEAKTKEKVNKETLKSNSDMPKTAAKETTVKFLKDKRSLKRATSPGKLEKDKRSLKKATSPKKVEKGEKNTRSSRLRQPVKFSLDEDDK